MRRFIYLFLTAISVISVGHTAYAAKAKAKKADSAEILKNGREAFLDYDFDEAEDFFEEYENMQSKSKKPVSVEFEEWKKQLNIATNAFGRVQQIVVIDSISMPRASFYKAFNLSTSAGKAGLPKDFKLENIFNSNEVSFLSEEGDYFITTQPNEEGDLMLTGNRKLLDNTWEPVDILEGDFEKDGDYAFPFLSGDGQTLYFANNGKESMGGFDLFVAQKEPITGESLQPLNLGMPFNSPYDDLMMVVDDERGIGWWATDRNSPGGDITVYVYLLEEIRKNYPSDTENLIDFAKISNYKATWDPEREEAYKKILESLK
ncbi:MAG: hypothetical protein J1F43_04000 [Muribaculaceae bacterium]|nr:hypothetical protein [Muribaculaceae bacterium]